MSKANAKKFLEKLSKDKTFTKEFVAEEAQALLKFAKKAGFECTVEELKEVTGGMTDAEYFSRRAKGEFPFAGGWLKFFYVISLLFVRGYVYK